jgi:hypothetical protein
MERAMQYVPTILPYRVDLGRTEEPETISAVQSVKPITARRVPPLIYQHRIVKRQTGASEEEIQKDLIERRREATGRRHVCRRIDHAPVTLDTRTEHDRRSGARRNEDHLDASVDIEA